MLYVFLVDTGTMIQLDMNVALEKVEYLKGVIARTCCIPPEKQVLLISGGESLDANETVCKYSMGTDTNPIFLFSMVSIESTLPPEVPAEYNTGEAALNEKVENSFSLRDTQNTVAIRTSLAQEYVKGSTAQTRSCETLIHDQHLQHQGWLAVVANLEDLASDIQKQLARMESNYNMYLSRREEYQNLVDSFDEDLAILHQIPIFPALLKPEITESMAGSVLPDKPYKDKSGKSINLLEWINSRGSSQSLDQVADSCYRAIQQMDEELLTDLKGKVLAAVEGSGNSQMKEIRGLGDRLAGLEQLLLEAKRLVQEQQDMAQAFIQNQQRASGLQDNSILPDLCASHKQQLIVMKDNNSRVISIRSRCSKAKSELSANLHRRMKWVVFIQDQMAEVGRTLLMHAEEIRRLTRKMEVIEQIHTAPAIYMATVLEVVRRKAFSGHYLSSTASLAETFSTLHKEEIILRTNYQAKIKKHFLSKMFPGMDDYPPPFANDCPGQFDNCLPEITLSDVEQLRQKFPDLAKSLSVPESNALSNLLARSFNQKLTPEEGETLYSLQNLPGKITIHSNDIASVSVLNRLISVEHPSSGRRKLRKHPSAAGNSSDSETDTDADINTRRQNGPSKRRDRNKKAENNLTRSLPLENSVLTLTNSYSAKNDELKVNNISSDSMEKTPENENRLTPIKDINGRNGSVGNVDHHISSSSADPSSSSGGNTSVSVAPSSSSDGSALLNSKLKVNGTGIAEEGMDKYASLMIDSLNSKVISTENMFKRLQDDVKSVCLGENGDSSLQRLRHDLMELKNQVLEDKDEYNFMIKEFSKVLASQIGHVEILSKRQTDVVLRNQSEIDTRHAKEILELEQNKLSDCHREIEIYREQLEHSTRELDCMKSDAIDEKVRCEEYVKKEVEEKDRERGEAIKKLMLEHELELETLRHELERSEKVLDYQRQVSALKSRLHENEGNIANLTEKLNNLQGIHEEKLLSEKEKIVHILEAGFVQREKLAIQQVESDLEVKFNKEMKDAVIEHQATREGEKEKIRDELMKEKEEIIKEMKRQFEREYEELQNRQQEISAAAVDLERQKFTDEQNKTLQLQAKQLRAKYKCDMDGMRARFKIMQNSGALDRSPSASESELSLESPRQDLVESIRSAIALEYDNNLRAERSKWERQMVQLRDDHEQALIEIKSKQKLRDSAEQQVLFNEALAKLKDSNSGKDKEIKNLESSLQMKTKELEEREKLFTSSTMGTSVMTVPSESNGGMSRSVNKFMSGKISVTSVDKGDTVMVVWNEDHNNYVIYTEPSAGLIMHFLHSDCLLSLGLTPSSSTTSNGGDSSSPRKLFSTGEVVDKEYCQAKKAENRFRVPQGTKFYRVKCKPAFNT